MIMKDSLFDFDLSAESGSLLYSGNDCDVLRLDVLAAPPAAPAGGAACN